MSAVNIVFLVFLIIICIAVAIAPMTLYIMRTIFIEKASDSSKVAPQGVRRKPKKVSHSFNLPYIAAQLLIFIISSRSGKISSRSGKKSGKK